MPTLRRLLPALLLLLILATPRAPGQDIHLGGAPGGLDLILPTANDALLRPGADADYFMYIERDFEGVTSKPWQGGQYGFVRNPARFGPNLVLCTRFHEGLDIRPLQRDPTGEPLDPVRAVADGQVAHTSPDASKSSYGRHVILRHLWGGCPYYTLYAHLSRIDVQPGQDIHQGDTLGILGHTGPGLDRVRAHLHFEINLILQPDFDRWHTAYFAPEPNWHGIHNGLNLAGLDPAALLRALRDDPALDIPRFLATHATPSYTVAVPGPAAPAILATYPWMSGPPDPANPVPAQAPSWEITLDPTGLPLLCRPSPRIVTGDPQITWFHPQPDGRLQPRTKSYLTLDKKNRPWLTTLGLRYISLLTGVLPKKISKDAREQDPNLIR